MFVQKLLWPIGNGQLSQGIITQTDPLSRATSIFRGAFNQMTTKTGEAQIEAAARAFIAGLATITPKGGHYVVEIIRLLNGNKNLAINNRTSAINQIKVILVTAPALLPVQNSVLLGRTLLLQLRKRCVIWLVECCN